MTEKFSGRVELVKSFLDGMADLDFEHVGDHLADDAVMVLPFLDVLPPVQGRAAIVEQVSATMAQMIEQMEFTYDEWYDVSDSDTLIAEYRSEATLKHNLGVYRNQYITVFHFAGDKIALYKEFLNPANLAAFAAQGADQ
jgi:ketosteroid isomerase-like protein